MYTMPQSAAREMGIQIGDELISLNDVILTDPETFTREVRKENVNAKLRFRVRRGGQELKIEGRIGSYDKTMKAYQEEVRKRLLGKPLWKLPSLVWWNETTRTFEEKAGAVVAAPGKVTTIMAFDDCNTCKEKRFLRMKQMSTLLANRPGGELLAFCGIFYGDRAGLGTREANAKAAAALLAASPPGYPVSLAYYAGDRPTAADRDEQAVVHSHGTVIVGTEGKVEFVQVIGEPEQEFGMALQKLLLGAAGAAPPAGTEKSQPPAPPKPEKK